MRIFHTLLFSIICAFGASGQVGALVWEDNFNGQELDTSKWNIETGTGVNGDWGTGQLDRATDRTENLDIVHGIEGATDGCLAITTRKEFYIDREYTSGRVTTAGKASWGPGHRIEARVYPRDVKWKGQGFAFWMMPDELPAGFDWIMWPQGGEIDIMEYVGSIPYHNLGGVHYAWFWLDNEWHEWNHGHLATYYSYETKEVPVPASPDYGGYPPEEGDPNAGSSLFHTYGIDWYADRMEFFIDDHIYHIHYLNDGGAYEEDGEDEKTIMELDGRRVGVSEYSNHFEEWYPFEHRMFAILSAGVGGSQYTYGGAIVPEADFPCSVFIDWVRVYHLETTATEDVQDLPTLQVYPNPALDVLNITTSMSGTCDLEIMDMNGRVVIARKITGSDNVDISDLSAGPYIVRLLKDDLTLSAKVIIE